MWNLTIENLWGELCLDIFCGQLCRLKMFNSFYFEQCLLNIRVSKCLQWMFVAEVSLFLPAYLFHLTG